MKIKLLLVEKNVVGQRLVSYQGSHFVVGRKNSNLNVDDARCSQQHFVLFQGAGKRLWLKDLASTNGTKVNGSRVKETVLSKRDEIRFGSSLAVVLEFEATKQDENLKPLDGKTLQKEVEDIEEVTTENTLAMSPTGERIDLTKAGGGKTHSELVEQQFARLLDGRAKPKKGL